jgi:toxin ParE1/3/4
MPEVLHTRQAHADLSEIWLFIARDNVPAADRLMDAVAARCRLLATMPELGRKRDELAAGVRSFPTGNYLIFYKRVPDGIQVLRVLHGTRDIPPLFE